MTRASLVAGVLVMASAVSWSLVLVFAPIRIDQGAGTLLALDLLVASVVSVAGMAIPRSRWARRLATGLVVAPLGVLAIVPAGWAPVLASIASIGALIALTGPWLRSYIGSLPRGDAPPPLAVLLALALLLQPGWIAIVSHAGLGWGLWVLAAGCFLLAWAYGRAVTASVPILRFAYVPASVAAVLASPLVEAGAILLYSAVVTALAWTSDARQAVHSPEPISGTAIPMPLRSVPTEIRLEMGDET